MDLTRLLTSARLLPQAWNDGSVRDRRWERAPCQLLAVMNIPAANIEIEGLLMEVSRGGLLFRPASRYILERIRERVTVKFESFALDGVIMRTMPKGYGIALADVLSDEAIESIVALGKTEARYGN